VIWAKSAGGQGYDFLTSVAVGDTGNIYLTGYFGSDTLIFGADSLINAGWNDIFLAKYDTNGNVLWAQSAGGTGNDRATSVASDTLGNTCLTGCFYNSTLIFGSYTLTNAGQIDIFLAKYNANGNVNWAKSEGGLSDDYAHFNTMDASGNIYMAGGFESPNINFGSNTLTNVGFGTGGDIFLTKYSTSGNVLWAKSAGGTDDDYAGSVALDSSGNIFLTGGFESSNFTFGVDTLTSAGYYDIFIAKTGFIHPVAAFVPSDSTICPNTCIDVTDLSSGQPTTWNWLFPGSSTPSSTMQNPTNICYATPGTYPVTLTVTNTKGTDTITHCIFVSPLPVITAMAVSDSICFGSGTDIIGMGASTYSWAPSSGLSSTVGDTVTANLASTTTYTVTGTDSIGCSNTSQIVITVITVDTSITVNQLTLISNATGNYQWYDCNLAGIIQDSISISYTATANGSYAVIVTQNGCTDTSFCYLITTVGITENSDHFNFSVFPNPTDDYIKVNITEKATIEILNIDGQIIKTINNEGIETTINLVNFSSGVYFIKVKTDKGITIDKLIKK
jgi:PKD repeat protein